MNKKILLLDILGFGLLILSAIQIRYFMMPLGFILLLISVGILLGTRQYVKNEVKE